MSVMVLSASHYYQGRMYCMSLPCFSFIKAKKKHPKTHTKGFTAHAVRGTRRESGATVAEKLLSLSRFDLIIAQSIMKGFQKLKRLHNAWEVYSAAFAIR